MGQVLQNPSPKVSVKSIGLTTTAGAQPFGLQTEDGAWIRETASFLPVQNYTNRSPFPPHLPLFWHRRPSNPTGRWTQGIHRLHLDLKVCFHCQSWSVVTREEKRILELHMSPSPFWTFFIFPNNSSDASGMPSIYIKPTSLGTYTCSQTYTAQEQVRQTVCRLVQTYHTAPFLSQTGEGEAWECCEFPNVYLAQRVLFNRIVRSPSNSPEQWGEKPAEKGVASAAERRGFVSLSTVQKMHTFTNPN